MAFVVTFVDYLPPARFDGLFWTTVKIEESASSSGPWTLIETKPFPAYTNAAEPPSASFTTELATLQNGWYRLTFVDATGDVSQPTVPVHNADDTTIIAYAPTVDQVGALLRARTKDKNGVEKGTFTANTRPTRAEAYTIIQSTADDVVGKFSSVATPCQETAREAIKLKAAMEIELSYFPEQVATGRSPFEQYRELYTDSMENLEACVALNVTPGVLSPNSPAFKFLEEPPIIGLKTVM